MAKWILGSVLLVIAILAAIYSNPDWRQHIAKPGGLIGSIFQPHDTYRASTKLPSGSASRVPLPDPTISVADDRYSGAPQTGSQALGGTVGPSGATVNATPPVASAPPAAASTPPPAAHPSPPLPASNGTPRLNSELAEQINAILRTRQTPRGLVTMLPDALFEPGSALLASTGQLRLAKIAGVILLHPGSRIEVDSYTGPAEVFQSGLSAGRAASVRLFLVSQGVDEHNIVQKSVTVPPTEAKAGLELSRDVALVLAPSR